MTGNLLDFKESRELSASELHLLMYPTEEEEDEVLRKSDEIICLNVGGKKHWVMVKNFVQFPGTRLGKLVRAKSTEEILTFCQKFWPGDIKEYFFDISWIGFNSILDVHRMGNLHLSNGVCALVTKYDLEFWGIDELLLEPCCALKYYPEIELCVKEIEGEENSRKKHQQRKLTEDFGNSTLGHMRKYLWNMTEYPETSKAAQVAAFVSLGAIVISTFCFILSTFPELQDEEAPEEEVEEEVDNSTGFFMGVFNSNEPLIDYCTVRSILRIIDIITVIYFFLEYALRFACSPIKAKFFFQPMNFVDFLAILPYLISCLVESLQDLHILGKAGKIMRLVRVMRILRIFKLVRHFAGLQSLLYTLKQAYKELGLLIILVGVAVLTFSSLVFYAEKDSPVLQWTFIDSFWWGLMTLTTVGYGTQSPSSITGKAIGGVCAIVGVFILTLPVPIVVNSFASYYKNRLWRNEVAHRRRLRSAEQAKMVKEILNSSRRPSFCGSHVNSLELRTDLEGNIEGGTITSISANGDKQHPSGATEGRGARGVKDILTSFSSEDRRKAFASLALSPRKNNNSFASKECYLSVPKNTHL